jgi:hypothetical protein
MARSLALVAVLCTLASCGSSLAAQTASSAGAACGPASQRTLARTSHARVYEIRHTVYGCASGAHRRYRLGTIGLCPGRQSLGLIALTGRITAYVVRSCGVDTSSAQVAVLRLSDGRRLSSHEAVMGVSAPESFQSVSSLAVTSRGEAAWIGSSSSIALHRTTTQVLAANEHITRVLDPGPGIVAGSLQLHGRTVSWKRAGARRTAALP